jgi:hypothetical protein
VLEKEYEALVAQLEALAELETLEPPHDKHEDAVEEEEEEELEVVEDQEDDMEEEEEEKTEREEEALEAIESKAGPPGVEEEAQAGDATVEHVEATTTPARAPLLTASAAAAAPDPDERRMAVAYTRSGAASRLRPGTGAGSPESGSGTNAKGAGGGHRGGSVSRAAPKRAAASQHGESRETKRAKKVMSINWSDAYWAQVGKLNSVTGEERLVRGMLDKAGEGVGIPVAALKTIYDHAWSDGKQTEFPGGVASMVRELNRMLVLDVVAIKEEKVILKGVNYFR